MSDNKRTVANPNYSRRSEPQDGFKSLQEFYPFYLGEHCNKINRRLHFLGTTLSLVFAYLAARHRKAKFLLAGILQGYFLAWIGHFVFEKNKPATFRYPLWSFLCDWKMWFEIVTRKRLL
ncbi:hypothetical protein G6F70_006581 [Rhizopus microsporus]|nr:hypothetical protein G6F71_003715 [Rhizopus microsporus]KAG1197491.1 hypothetical protein G6F70_006581 [Rhizopus microsporus]KAG1210534.1 hypothetical protein G6F69_005391 [Rhizopus microsporus]KAG1230689.1 hypothetical protein G6F67_006284 [Rhizopus microsporus]KAG1267002.1 hypothetical protein G6F68_002301 [Rhizopus microsporus]